MNQDAPEGRGFLSQGSSSGTWTQLWHKRPLQALTEWWERPTLIDPKTEVHGDREITEPCPQTLHKYIALVPGILKKKMPEAFWFGPRFPLGQNWLLCVYPYRPPRTVRAGSEACSPLSLRWSFKKTARNTIHLRWEPGLWCTVPF